MPLGTFVAGCGSFRLPNDPQPATKVPIGIHGRIFRKRGADLLQWMIERKIMRDDSGEHTRLACWFWRPAKTNFQNIVVLLCVNRVLPDGSRKSVTSLFPMKN